MDRLLSVPDVAELLVVSRTQVYRFIEREGLPALRLSNRVQRFRESDIRTVAGEPREGVRGLTLDNIRCVSGRLTGSIWTNSQARNALTSAPGVRS